MKTLRMLQRGAIRWRHRSDDAPLQGVQTETELPEVCPAAKCSRCGYEFLAYTVTAVCPRCLERFTREPCYGSCFSCPLLAASAGEAK